MAHVTQHDCQRIAKKLNTRPRTRLNYQTPEERFHAASAHSAGHEVSIGVTLFFSVLLVAMILCLAFEEKLHARKSVIVGAFAAASLLLGGLLGLLPFSAMDLHVGDADPRHAKEKSQG